MTDFPDKQIYKWGEERGIENLFVQVAKLQEENGELAAALVRENDEEAKDALGDVFVVLCQIARIKGFNLCDCVWGAYREISLRRGRLNGVGSFIKEGVILSGEFEKAHDRIIEKLMPNDIVVQDGVKLSDEEMTNLIVNEQSDHVLKTRTNDVVAEYKKENL